ncbi:MAG: hypothetical protein ACI841_002649 [Planctomycetota bacterium]
MRNLTRELSFGRRLAREPHLTNTRSLTLLAECAHAAVMQRNITVIETEIVS